MCFFTVTTIWCRHVSVAWLCKIRCYEVHTLGWHRYIAETAKCIGSHPFSWILFFMLKSQLGDKMTLDHVLNHLGCRKMHTQDGNSKPSIHTSKHFRLSYVNLFLHVTPTVTLFCSMLRYPLSLMKSTPNENRSLEFHWSKGRAYQVLLRLFADTHVILCADLHWVNSSRCRILRK